MADETQTWAREFSGSLAEITAATQWVDQLALKLKLTSDKTYALRLCAEELLTNILSHGGSEAPRIRMTIAMLPGRRVELVVEDDGKPFDVSAANPRQVGRPIEKAQPGGLGIGLIRNCTDRLNYERAGLGNRVVAEIASLPKARIGS